MGFTIKFIPNNVTVTVDDGTTILDAQIKAGLVPDAPCGGKGTCGKCLVNVTESKEISGIVKACQIKIHEDMTVDLINVPKGYNLLTQGVEREIDINPGLKSVDVTVKECIIGDNRSDWERLKDAVAERVAINEKAIPPNIRVVADLYNVLQDNDYKVNVIVFNDEILEVRAENKPIYIVAFDIGTTSVVGYLLDAATGKELAVASMLNPQAQFGADVIQRSNYAIEHGTKELADAIRGALNQLIEKVCKKAKIDVTDVYAVNLVGNTCMNHLFFGITPGALVHSPYNPSLSETVHCNAGHVGIKINPVGKLTFLSNIAGFVGADTVGVLLATGFDEIEPITLAIDIGTNGELVLGNKDRAITCSTAAGPAFEGAKIECGMRGSEGAIDHLQVNGTNLEMSVIGDKKPIGICGSGLMDIICIMIETGIVDEGGRIVDEDELTTDFAKANAGRITEIDGKKAFVLADKDASGNGEPVFIGQKDVREVQLAKGAMAAGIELMSKQLGIQTEDIKQVMIAGAFGNYMDPHSACAIGLIPRELEDRIIPIGNAAGEGSKIAALSRKECERSQRMAKHTEFLELATDPDFQDCFVDQLEFPEQDQ
ncbi:MAG: DUF4445 domain-containing protein [Lachnospiraceae bacterium]|jgi:uncharacterized 2Fe-2S/4Fe-4S cluster protein (DUF4445 family)|nr:DUF4445 domain-containing protein [Lachnospiraceae bacterium]